MTLPAGIIKITTPQMDTYHLGSLFDKAVPAHVGAYTTDAGTQLPAHWWGAAFRDRQAPITIKRSHADLVAAYRMFPMGDTGCKYYDVSALPATPMGSSSITKGMGQTGERPDIGWVTDWAAWWALTKDAGPMLQIALAAASCPIRFRDETTGRPIDLLKYPQANVYSQDNQGSPWLPRALFQDSTGRWWPGYDDDWGPQQAHFCEMSGIASMATEDDGFLEDLQYQANFVILSDASASTPAGAIISGEVRGIGWALRTLFMAHIATKDREVRGPLPSNFQPSSYFKKLLDQSLAFWSARMGGAVQKAFHCWYDENVKYSPWTEDYIATALAYGVLTGHADWVDMFLFKLGNTIARTNGTSGWPLSLCTPYRIPTGSATTWAQCFDGLMTDPEVMLSKADHDSILANPLNGGKLSNSEPYGYHFTTRAVLVMADYLDKKGLAPVRATYPDFDPSLQNVERMFLANGTVNPRVSVVSTAPIVIDPPPVITPPDPPSTTEPHMKTFADLVNIVHAAETAEASATLVITTLIQRLKDMAAAAVGAGTSVDPAAIDALATELEGKTAELASAVANVPPA